MTPVVYSTQNGSNVLIVGGSEFELAETVGVVLGLTEGVVLLGGTVGMEVGRTEGMVLGWAKGAVLGETEGSLLAKWKDLSNKRHGTRAASERARQKILQLQKRLEHLQARGDDEAFFAQNDLD